MARVVFPAVLRRHVACPPLVAEGRSVRQVVDAAFRERPDLRGYLLDDQGGLRRHVALFVDGTQVRDREGLGDAVAANSVLEFFQALSGGLIAGGRWHPPPAAATLGRCRAWRRRCWSPPARGCSCCAPRRAATTACRSRRSSARR